MVRKHQRIFARVVALVFCLTIFIGVTPAFADEAEGANASFYKLASVASTYLSSATANADKTEWQLPSNVTAAAAGGLLGYSDAADESGIVAGWISSMASRSSASFSYASLRNVNIDADESGHGGYTGTSSMNSDALWQYTQYGRFLNLCGFDNTGTTSGMHPIKMIAALLLRLGYYLAATVEGIFDAIISFLRDTNPFRFFNPGDADYMGLTEDSYFTASPDGNMRNLATFISGIYQWFISQIPFFVAIWVIALIVGIFLNKDGWNGRNAKIKRFCIRLCAITIAIPLIAGTYTTVLNYMTDLEPDLDMSAAGREISHLFVDFGSWAQNRNLGIPASVDEGTFAAHITSDGRMNMTYDTAYNLRDTAYYINRYSGAISYAGNMDNVKDAESVNSLLDKYASGEMYYPGSYEGYVKSRDAFTYDEFKKVVDKSGTSVETFRANREAIFTKAAANTLWGSKVAVWSDYRNADICTQVSDHNGTTLDFSGLSGSTGLSTMSVYNYLNSTFGTDSVTVYSSENASSALVRDSHFAVNMVGTYGLMRFLFWANALAMLASYAILGWLYSVSLIISCLKRSVHMIMTIPFGIIGSLKAIARLIIYAIMMILDIVLSLSVYYIMAAVLRSIDGLIMTPISAIIGTFTYTGQAAAGATPSPAITGTIILGDTSMVAVDVGAVICIYLIIKLIFMILFAMTSISFRKSIIKFVDEMVTEWIEKLFGVKAMPEGGGGAGLGARMAGAVGAGMGAAMAQKSLSGGETNSADTKGVATAKPEDGGKSGEKGSSGPPAVAKGDSAGGPDGPSDGGDGGGDSSTDASTAEGGDVTIEDNDTASASFDGDDSDEQSEMNAAENMESLSEGDSAEVSSDADGASPESVDAGDSGPEGGQPDGQDSPAEAAAKDPQGTLDAVGADAVSDVQDMAESAGDDAAAMMGAGDDADGGASGTPGIKASEAHGQDSGSKGATVQGTKTGAAAGESGKLATGNQQPEFRSSKSASEAAQRNAATAARLAALKAEGLPEGQSGQPSQSGSGGKTGVAGLKVGADGKPVAAGPDGKAIPGGKDAKGVQAGGQVQGGSQQPAVSGSGNPVQAVGPGGSPQGVKPGAVPTGDKSTGGNPSVGPGQQGASQQGVPGGKPVPGVPAGQGPQGGPVGPGGAGHAAPVGPGVGSGGPGHGVNAGPVSGPGIPGQGAGPQGGPVQVPAGSSVTVTPGGKPASDGKRGDSVDGPVQGPQGQSGQAVQGQAAQPAQVQNGQPVQQGTPQQGVPGQAGVPGAGGQPAVVEHSGDGKIAKGTGIADSHSESPVKPADKPAPVQLSPKQKSVAGAAAKAAMAAFMASSSNPMVSGVGQGMQFYQAVDMMRKKDESDSGRRGGQMEGLSQSNEDELIAAYDASTAEMEAEIRELEAAKAKAKAAGGNRKLNQPRSGLDEEII